MRTFLGWFGAQRRGYWKVQQIRNALSSAGLATEPDFEGAYIDSEIGFRLAPAPSEAKVIDAAAGTIDSSAEALPAASGALELVGGGESDPTYRIGKLAAANTPPLSVTPDSLLQQAVTLMLLNDFSQLPVMQGERSVKGVISWQSIGSRLAMGCTGVSVKDYMDTASEISAGPIAILGYRHHYLKAICPGSEFGTKHCGYNYDQRS